MKKKGTWRQGESMSHSGGSAGASSHSLENIDNNNNFKK